MVVLENKRLLIVGVRNRRSLAYAIAAQATAEGAKLAFSTQPTGDKTHDKTAAIIKNDFPDARIFSCDAGNDEDIIAAVNNTAKALGGLDGLVHAIAYAKRETITGFYHEGIDRAAFSEALDISAYTLTAFANAALPHFAQAGGGSVVTLSYLGAERALPNYNVMGVAKAALEASVRYLAYGMGLSVLELTRCRRDRLKLWPPPVLAILEKFLGKWNNKRLCVVTLALPRWPQQRLFCFPICPPA